MSVLMELRNPAAKPDLFCLTEELKKNPALEVIEM